MGVGSILSNLLKGKILVTTLIGATLVVGTGVALAATSPGKAVVETLTGIHATVTATHQADTKTDNDKATASATADSHNNDSKSCPGQPDAQNLATKFSLSTDSKSSSMQVICTLHDGTFQGLDHALGYGEIDQLLTFAQSLGKKANTTLSDSNLQTSVAAALKTCGSTPIVVCVNTNMPGNSNGDDNSNGHDSGKPTVTPVLTPHGDGKPTGTPTPRAN